MLSFLIISELGLLNSLDRHAYNLGLLFSSAKDPHEDIVIIAIDDKSLQKEAEKRLQNGKQMAAAIKRCHDQVKENEAA